jgi:hypothetical protein
VARHQATALAARVGMRLEPMLRQIEARVGTFMRR